MSEGKIIRAKMKEELNYNSRKVSVRCNCTGLSMAIKFTIRSLDVDFYKVEKFSEQFKSVDYDQASGEILAGGNTFIHIDFSEETKKNIHKKYKTVIENSISQIKGNNLSKIDGTVFSVGGELHDYTLYNKNKTNVRAYDVLSISLSIHKESFNKEKENNPSYSREEDQSCNEIWELSQKFTSRQLRKALEAKEEKELKKKRISNPEHCFRRFEKWKEEDQEIFLVMFLDGAHSCINVQEVSRGLVNRTIVQDPFSKYL